MNRGGSFSDPIFWAGAADLGDSRTAGFSLSGAFTIGFPIGILPLKIVVNPSTNYGTSLSRQLNSIREEGDHYLQPETAAAFFGLVNKLSADFGFNISLGDMSSSNGTDPWQPGFKHHAGHGHLGRRSGLDADFRYLNADGTSFQSSNAFNNSSFSSFNNQQVYDAAATFGFTKNYQGTSGNLTGAIKVGGHNDHGHLGLQYKSLNWKYVPTAPNNSFNWLNR